MRVRSLGREDPLEEGMAAHSNVLAWRTPWTEEPGGLLSTGSQRVGHDWSDLTHGLPGKSLAFCLFSFLHLDFAFRTEPLFLFLSICLVFGMREVLGTGGLYVSNSPKLSVFVTQINPLQDDISGPVISDLWLRWCTGFLLTIIYGLNIIGDDVSFLYSLSLICFV